MRRLKTKAARETRDVPDFSSPRSQPVSGAVISRMSSSLPGNAAIGLCSAEELAAQILSSELSLMPQLLSIFKDRSVPAAIEDANICADLTLRVRECLQHGLTSLAATLIVTFHLWEPSIVLACVDYADARHGDKGIVLDVFLSCPDFPPLLIDCALAKLSPSCAVKSIRKHQLDLRTFPSIFQHAVFKELAWICSQFEFNQVFGTLLLSAIDYYPDVPVLSFVKQRLPHFFQPSKKLFLQNVCAELLPSLPPPSAAPSGSFSVPSHVNMRLVSDALGLIECIDMVRANSTIGIDMEWSGTGVLTYPCGQVPADIIQIGNSPSALHCSVFLLDTKAIRQEYNLVQILFCEMFSSSRTVLVCDFSADRLALHAAFPEAIFPKMVAPQLLDLSISCGKCKKSLSSLAKDVCQINLSKSWQICGWNFRPWLQSQLEYATCDVLVMHLVHEQQLRASCLQP